MATLQAKNNWCIENKGSFLQHFHSLTVKADTTFRVFDHGEFYSVHGKDAFTAAKLVFNAATSVKTIKKGDEELSSIYLSKLNFESLARELLLVLHYRLEIYQPSPKSQWFIAFKASPGNLMEVEDLLFNNVDLMSTSSAALAVRFRSEGGQFLVAIGFVDTNLCEIKYAEFFDNDQFSNLESAIIQLCPKECLSIKMDTNSEAKKLNEIIKRCGVLLTERPKTDFAGKNIEQDLKRLLKTKKKSVEEGASLCWTSDHPLASTCVSSLILYLELTSKEEKFGQFVAEKYDLSQHVKLDSAANSALNLFSERSFGTLQQNRPADSLYGVLNHCQTPQGQRLLSRWIKQPLLDINHLEERLSAVESFVDCGDLRQILTNEHLKKLPDFEKLSKKFLRKKASLQDCYRVYQAIKQLPFLCETLQKYSNEPDRNKTLLQELFTTPIHELYNSFKKFIEMLDTTLDFEMIEKHEFLVKSDFDPELQRLRSKMNDIEVEIEKVFQKAASDLEIEAGKTLKLEMTSQYGYVFRVTCKEEKILRNNKKFTTLDTNKAGVRFVNSRLQELSSDYEECKGGYQEQQNAVVMEIVTIASGYAEPLHSLGGVVAKLDVLLSFAQATVIAPVVYVRPKLHAVGTGSNRIKLIQCRHPCVEIQDGVSFIPNDVTLEQDKENFLIVTGPNMGGKSTYIRQVGVTVLMAQIGCFVPCEAAEITLVDAILARVGAGDCQVQGVSTFMAEMLETSTILRSATENSLVIIDELGRGTSTYDGFGLAWAISHEIAVNIKSPCLFATHFDEMTSLADEVQTVANYHVTALTNVDEDGRSTLTMLYQLKPGSCDRSFGIHVAECVGFPERVIAAAQQKASELEDYYVTPSCGVEENEASVSRKRRKIKQEGEDLIKKFLEQFREINWNEISSTERAEKLEQLKAETLSANNGFVDGVLKKKRLNETAV